MSTLVLYCTWGVTENSGEFFVESLHNLYIKEALKIYDQVVLLTTQSRQKFDGLQSIDSRVNVHLLPETKSYLSSLKYFRQYKKQIKKITSLYKDADYYLRCPQPFTYLFHFYASEKSKLVFHFMSNPIEAILNKIGDNYIVRVLKCALFLPDFLFTSYCATKHKCTCNGLLLKEKLSIFLPKKTIVLDESTLLDSDFINSDNLTLRLANEPIKLLYVGYLREAKGVSYLINSLSVINDMGLDFYCSIAGGGPDREKLVSLVKDLDLKDKVEFLGNVSDRKELLEIYRLNHIFVFPSLSEGSPRVVIEAMSQGTPCIATDVGNTKNLILDNGFVVDTKSTSQIVDYIIEYYNDEPLRRKHALLGLLSSRRYTLTSFFYNFKNV